MIENQANRENERMQKTQKDTTNVDKEFGTSSVFPNFPLLELPGHVIRYFLFIWRRICRCKAHDASKRRIDFWHASYILFGHIHIFSLSQGRDSHDCGVCGHGWIQGEGINSGEKWVCLSLSLSLLDQSLRIQIALTWMRATTACDLSK